jgi:hypothetical protein
LPVASVPLADESGNPVWDTLMYESAVANTASEPVKFTPTLFAPVAGAMR